MYSIKIKQNDIEKGPGFINPGPDTAWRFNFILQIPLLLPRLQRLLHPHPPVRSVH